MKFQPLHLKWKMNSSFSRVSWFDVRSRISRLGRFTAVSITAAVVVLLTCTAALVRADGVAWTTRTSAYDGTWRAVTWGGTAGQETFVAVSSTGT